MTSCFNIKKLQESMQLCTHFLLERMNNSIIYLTWAIFSEVEQGHRHVLFRKMTVLLYLEAQVRGNWGCKSFLSISLTHIRGMIFFFPRKKCGKTRVGKRKLQFNCRLHAHPTNNAPFIIFRLSSDAEILLISTD